MDLTIQKYLLTNYARVDLKRAFFENNPTKKCQF